MANPFADPGACNFYPPARVDDDTPPAAGEQAKPGHGGIWIDRRFSDKILVQQQQPGSSSLNARLQVQHNEGGLELSRTQHGSFVDGKRSRRERIRERLLAGPMLALANEAGIHPSPLGNPQQTAVSIKSSHRNSIAVSVSASAIGDWSAKQFSLNYASGASPVYRKRIATETTRTNDEARRSAYHALIKEVAITSRLKHQNIASCLGVEFETDDVEDDSKPVISWPVATFERAECGTLEDVLLSDMTFDIDTLLRWIAGISSAVFFLHDRFVVHRDIRPSNMVFGKGMIPKLCGFQMAAVGVKESDETSPPISSGGTEWEGPELFVQRQLGTNVKICEARFSDIYSLGVILAVVCCSDGDTENAIARYERESQLAGVDQLQEKKLTAAFREELESAIASRPRNGLAGHLYRVIDLVRSAVQPSASDRNYQQFKALILHFIGSGTGEGFTTFGVGDTPIIDGSAELSKPYTKMSNFELINNLISVQDDVCRELQLLIDESPDDRKVASWKLAQLLLDGCGSLETAARGTKAYALLCPIWPGAEYSSGFRAALGVSHTSVTDQSYELEGMKSATHAGYMYARLEFRRCYPVEYRQELPFLHWPPRPSSERLSLDFGSVMEILEYLPLTCESGSGDAPSKLFVLITAARLGHLEIILWLYESLEKEWKVLINTADQFNDTALLWAARCGHAEICEELLNLGADPSIQSVHGDVALHWLANLDHVGDQRLLQLAGSLCPATHAPRLLASEVHSVDFLGWAGTPLHFAITHSSVPATRILLGLGANAHATLQASVSERCSPFVLAIKFNNFKVLEELVSFERQVFQRVHCCSCRAGSQQFIHADQASYLAVALDPEFRIQRARLHGAHASEALLMTIRILHGMGTSITALSIPHLGTPTTIVSAATMYGYNDWTRTLLSPEWAQEFPCLHISFDPLLTLQPLYFAVEHAKFPAFEALINHNPLGVFEWAASTGKPILHACASSSTRSISMLHLVLQRTSNRDCVDLAGKTALACALLQGWYAGADYLLASGCNLDAEHEGRTLFCRLLCTPSVPVGAVRYCLTRLVPPKTQCWAEAGRNLFHAFAIANSKEWDAQRAKAVFELLLKHPDCKSEDRQKLLNQTDRFQATPLLIAIVHHNSSLVQLFLEAGANPTLSGVTTPKAMAELLVCLDEGNLKSGSLGCEEEFIVRRDLRERRSIVRLIGERVPRHKDGKLFKAQRMSGVPDPKLWEFLMQIRSDN